MRWRQVCVLFSCTVALSSACGGRSVRHGDGEAGEGAEGPFATGGGGRSGGVGGTGFAGGGAVVSGAGGMSISPLPPGTCTLNGHILHQGEVVEDPEICLTCSCDHDGDINCSQCAVTCAYAAGSIRVGESVLQPDGCTACTCKVTGFDCDSSTCEVPDPCSDIKAEYELLIGGKRWCGASRNYYDCKDASVATVSIPCSCPVLVSDLDGVTAIQMRYRAMGCPVPEFCSDRCDHPRAPYRCGESGFCVGAI